MTPAACHFIEPELLPWWLGELEEADAHRVEEHVFACPACTERLQGLIATGDAIRTSMLRGELPFVATAGLVERMKGAGLRLREYAPESGGSVNCTITPDDDFVIARLKAPLSGVSRLDLLIDDDIVGHLRIPDVAFDPKAEALTVFPSARLLRTLKNERQRMRLVSVDASGERVIGDYGFNHFAS